MTRTSEEPYPQERGERTGEMQSLAGTATFKEFYERHLRLLKRLPTSKINDHEREDRIHVAEMMIAHFDGDTSISRAQVAIESARVNAKWHLKSPLPIWEFPMDRAAVAYAMMRYAVEIGRVGAEKSEQGLWEAGRGTYGRWYHKIEQEFETLTRLIHTLIELGKKPDFKVVRELLDRGNTVCAWLRVRHEIDAPRPAGARDIIFLPWFEYVNTDRWYGGRWREAGTSILTWWPRFEQKARDKVTRPHGSDSLDWELIDDF